MVEMFGRIIGRFQIHSLDVVEGPLAKLSVSFLILAALTLPFIFILT